MTGRYIRIHLTLCVVLLAGTITPLARAAESAPKPLRISKFYFMFHPVTWTTSMRGDEPPPLPDGHDPQDFLDTYEVEKIIVQKQKDFISTMKDHEVLILFPGGSHPAMKEIEAHATSVLGDRCVIIDRSGNRPPAAWAELDEPIRQFLDNKDLEGRAQFLRDIPPAVQTELENEIREACRSIGYKWNIAALKVVYTSRMYALDIERKLAERGLYYDPKTVRSEAFGEGFEECAMSWKAMVVPYLGLRHPADNIFDLSVSAARFLHKGRFHERVALDDQVRIYLWDGHENQAIALLARSWCRLKDPQLYAYLPTKDFPLEVWNHHKYGTRIWPDDSSPLEVVDGHLKVPVFNAIRRNSAVLPSYIVVRGMTAADLGTVLRKVRIEASESQTRTTGMP